MSKGVVGAVCAVDGSYVSLLGRCWAEPVVDGPYAVNRLCVVNEPHASSTSCVYRQGRPCVVDGRYALSMGCVSLGKVSAGYWKIKTAKRTIEWFAS